MRKLLYSFVLCPLILAACAKSGSNVAVVDMDKIANQLGWMDNMARNLQAADADLRNQVNGIVQKGLKDIEEAKQQVIKDAKLTEAQIKILNTARTPADLEPLGLTKEQSEKLNQTVAQANAALQNASQQYQQLMQGQRTKLIVMYRDTVRPVAQRIASAKGKTIVMTTTDNILSFDPREDDITDDVVAELRRTLPPPAPAPVAAPSTPAAPATPAKTEAPASK